jgi:hypothetical protein
MGRRSVLALLMLWGCGGDEGRSLPADGGAADGGCRSAAQCDDGVGCTRDLCTVDGTCEHVGDSAMCPGGMTCLAGRGCAPAGAVACTSTAQCDDRVECTRDACLVEGVCRSVAQDERCAAGQRCDAARGCVAGGVTPTSCRAPADCDDREACTDDVCGVDGRCAHVPQNARCGAGRRCIAGMGCIAERACASDRDCDDGMRCNGAERCSELACVAGATVACDDGVACTIDRCVEGSGEACTHAMDPSCAGATVRSGVYDLEVAVTYACSAFGTPVVMFSFRQMQFVVTGSSMTVNGGPVSMTGNVPDATGRFRVSGTMAGDCNETYTLEGTFSTATRFTGSFSTSFTGFSCGLTDCAARAWAVAATAR